MAIQWVNECREIPTETILQESQRVLCTEINVAIDPQDDDALNICFDHELVYAVRNRNVRWPELLKSCGVFASSSEARRAGHDRDIPEGLTELSMKRKLGFRPHMWKVFVLKRPQQEN